MKIPENSPRNQPIYVTGNFNNWDPGDERYQLQLNADSTFSVTLPVGFGKVEYKFTRGDWTTVEKDICGYEIDDRVLVLGDQDTVINQIQSWNDLDPVNCPRLTIIIDSIPEETPEDEVIAIAGNFNAWNPDQNAVLQKDTQSGKYALTIDRVPGIKELEFKVTRGNLETSESDEFGNNLPNRKVQFGVKDTVRLSVGGWVDKPIGDNTRRVIFMIKDLPKTTPVRDDIYLVSNLNNWTPDDRNYVFQRNKNGNLFFPFPRKKNFLEYKITRGSWANVEVDRFGFEIPNRRTNLENEDTVYISIGGWKDRDHIRDQEVTIILDELPDKTPANAEFYLTGDINGWNPHKRKYAFEKMPDGRFYLNVPRRGYALNYKITRGDWSNVEVNELGQHFENRVLFYQNEDTLEIDIINWLDLPPLDINYITIVIDELPPSTPANATLYLAPDFNGWNPEDRNLIFDKLPNGKPYITISGETNGFNYKITRGGWKRVETTNHGADISNRSVYYGFTDTLRINVAGWHDLN